MSTGERPDSGRRRAAREAYERGEWAEAHRRFSALYDGPGLAGEDLYQYGDAAWWLGNIRSFLRLCEESHARFLDEGRVDRAATVALEAAFQWFLCGQHELGSGWLSRARRQLEGLPEGVGHGWLVQIEAAERAGAGDSEGALDGARRLVEMATRLGEPVLRCFGLALEGTVLVRQGDLERGFALLDEAMLPVLAGQIGPAEAGNLYCQMMTICHDVADFERARHWTDSVERWCGSLDSAVMFVGICRVHRSQLLRLRGEWEAAAAAAAAAVRDLAEINVEAAAEAQYELAESLRLRGDLVEARRCFEAAAALGRSPYPGLALLDLAEGQPQAAHESLVGCLAAENDPFRRARLLAAQVVIACRRRDHDTASAAAAALEGIAATYPTAGFRAWAEQARGTVLLGCGQPVEAVPELQAALAGSTRLGSRYEVAHLHALLGRAFALVGDADAAAAQQTASRLAYAAIGLAAPDPGPGDPATSHGDLTRREVEVLTAIAEGLTNRQVAARLVISEKTVARHLANVYLKLGVSTRTAAAAWAHRQGISPGVSGA